MKDKETNKILEKAKNDADGKVTFKTINYSKADIGQTFNYIVEEEKGDKPGVTYDDMKVNVTVQVIQLLLVISCQQLSLMLLKVEMPLLRMIQYLTIT